MYEMEEDGLFEKAVLWEKLRPDNFGEMTVKYPIEIDCRWESRIDQILDANGNSITTKADVYTKCRIPTGSILWYGELADLPPVEKLTDLHYVITDFRIPDVKIRSAQKGVKLIAYKDTLPQVGLG